MASVRTAIVMAAAFLVPYPAHAQSVEGSCFQIETPSMRWEAGDLQARVIQEPPSELFQVVTRQLVVLERGGRILGIDGLRDGAPETGDWRLGGDSLSLKWERSPDGVRGSFEWSSDEELWLGSLQDGTADGEKGHWSATARLRPVGCEGTRTTGVALGRPNWPLLVEPAEFGW